MPVHAEPPPPVVYDPTGLQYQAEKQLGRGGFAICWQAQQTDGGRTPSKTVALKIVRSTMESKKLAQKFVTELQLHSKLHHHPNVVEFYRAFSFQSSTYVVLEVCPNGSLADCLKKRSYLSMPEVRRYLIQTCGAVKYLHMHNIVHRDLKTGNLFLDHEMNVKVGDFGLAAVLVGPHEAAIRRTTMCGTLNYIAPEVLQKNGKGHNEKVDVWAIGIIAYTLAVGKAPFHASKPEEVASKVATGEYAWPNLGKHEIIIPDDLRKLVSQILVDENSRPSLDTIVSHSFFKLGYLPETLSNDAIASMPEWTIRPPAPATIKRGYSDSWYKQCKASGVGEYAPGKFFSPIGDCTAGSIYRECEREAEAGKMPIVPMPDGTVYTPFVSKKGKGNTGGLENSEDRRLSATSSPLIEDSTDTKYNTASPFEAPPSKQRGVELRDIVPSTCARAISPASSCAENARTDRRPAGPRSKRALKETSIPVTEPAAKKPYTRSRLRTNPQPVVEEERKEPEFEPKPIIFEKRPIRPSRTQSTRHACRATSRTVARATVATRTALEDLAPQVTKQLSKPVLPPSSTKFAALGSKRLTGTHDSLVNLYADPVTILARAEELRNNIITALASSHNALSALHNWKTPANNLPFVSQWVDYSKKYGIGYILADGSVGIVVRHTDYKPLTHAVVDHGYEYLKATDGNPCPETVPFNFFAQANDGSLKEFTMSEANRKQHGNLWAKFAQYMWNRQNEQMSIRARERGERPITIVRYYQRVGNVGIWGFSDGCFQFNFPDHTKIVLSADGKYISFTALPLPAISHMATHSTDLPSEFINARKILSGSIYQLLYGNLPNIHLTSKPLANVKADVLALTAANALPAKLRFVADVVGHWVSGGGLGCKPARRRWPEWGVVMLEDDARGRKIEWITVGRFGGDAVLGEKMGKASADGKDAEEKIRVGARPVELV